MKGIIWGNTEQIAINKLDKMIEAYQRLGFSVVKRTRLDCSFDNGDTWRACRCNDNERGRKCNISYIDEAIPKDKVSNIIFPATIALPYTATHYYYD